MTHDHVSLTCLLQNKCLALSCKFSESLLYRSCQEQLIGSADEMDDRTLLLQIQDGLGEVVSSEVLFWLSLCWWVQVQH